MWKPTSTVAEPPVPPAPEKAPEPIPTSIEKPRSSSGAAQQNHAVIGKSLRIKGEITGSEPLLVDGHIEGSINVTGNYVNIGPNAVVQCNITAGEVIVRGNVHGNLTVADRVDIREGGSVMGDVSARRVSIEEGAFFKGSIDMQKSGKAPEDSKRLN